MGGFIYIYKSIHPSTSKLSHGARPYTHVFTCVCWS